MPPATAIFAISHDIFRLLVFSLMRFNISSPPEGITPITSFLFSFAFVTIYFFFFSRAPSFHWYCREPTAGVSRHFNDRMTSLHYRYRRLLFLRAFRLRFGRQPFQPPSIRPATFRHAGRAGFPQMAGWFFGIFWLRQRLEMATPDMYRASLSLSFQIFIS